jgi:periplasmic protein TonB
MQTNGFLAKPTHSPTSFGLAFVVTGAGLAALLLAKPYIVEKLLDPPLVVKSLPLPPPPPVRTPEVKQPVVRNTPMMIPQPRVPDTSTPRVPDRSDFTFPPGPTGGDVGPPVTPVVPRIEPVTPPVPVPVIIGSQYDTRYLRDQQPPYPAALQREEVEGSVTVRVHIGVDGRVTAIDPVRADHEDFFTATRNWALRHWRFKPATRDGVPIESTRTMSVRFNIQR